MSKTTADGLPAASSAATTGKKLGVIIARNTATMRVGRWMSEEEYRKMKLTGRVQEGAGGSTSVVANGPESFLSQARLGCVYVEFDVSKASLLQGGQLDWYKLVGPNAPKSMKFMLDKQGGELLPEVSNLTGILRRKP